ncbi:hypothetical protein HDU89_004703 [Geranomyces variabilis]|nr:hypothetical protein HDU89_004703 [Geranomyces variabilis]
MLKRSQRAMVPLPWHKLLQRSHFYFIAATAARPAQAQYLPSRPLSSTPTRRTPENENNDDDNEHTTFAAATDVGTTVAAQAYWWSFADDHKLLTLVHKHGNNWGAIQEEGFPHLSRFIIRQRWIKNVDPKLNIGNRWTVADDLILLKEIASGLPCAIPNASKKLNRHTSYVNKRFDFHWKHHLLVQAYGSAEKAEAKVETRIYGKPFSPAFQRAAQELVDELSLLPPTSRHHRKFDLNAIPFTKEENERLLEAVADVGSKWSTLQREFPFRTQSDLHIHYIKLVREKYLKDTPPPASSATNTGEEGEGGEGEVIIRGVWTADEDARVREGRTRFGRLRAWAQRTWQTLLPHRTPSTIANRWRSHLSPDFDRGNFSKQEIQLLKDALQQWDIHTQMKQIRRFFLPRRIPEDIRRAYFQLPVTAYRRYTPKETTLLEKLMKEKPSMEDVVPFFPDRPRHELLAHYMRNVTDRAALQRDWFTDDPDCWSPEIDEYVARMRTDGQMSWGWIALQLRVPQEALRLRYGMRRSSVETKEEIEKRRRRDLRRARRRNLKAATNQNQSQGERPGGTGKRFEGSTISES